MKLPSIHNRLRRAIERGFKNGKLSDELDELGEVTPVSRADGEAICWGLTQLNPADPQFDDDLRALAGLFQEVDDPECEAVEVLREAGIPRLIELLDGMDPAREEKGFGLRLFLLKILAIYGTVAGTLKIVEAARVPLDPEGYLWNVVFQCFGAEHPEKELLFRSLSDPLPPPASSRSRFWTRRTRC